MQQARLTASQPCQPDDLAMVSRTAEGFANSLGFR
jgi:hypothetical protein